MSEKLEAVKKRLLSFLFERCQPDRGDVFSWFDTHADEALAYALASPVVPVGSGEGERKLVGQDYINAIKAHRVEHGSSLAVARNAVDCGWRPPAPVVPVGVSEVLDAAAAYLKEQYGASHGLDHPVDRARIIAALRPTDTGRE